MLGSGFVLTMLGAAVIAVMPVPIWLRTMILSLWLVWSAAAGARLVRRYREITGYRIYADGTAEIIHADGRRVVAQLAAGTVLLPRLAWLRLRGPGGGRLSELVSGDPRASQQWRRFQVICRHVAAC